MAPKKKTESEGDLALGWEIYGDNAVELCTETIEAQTWESGGVIPVLPSYNPPGYYPGLFYMGRGRIRVIVG
jgi:hypothetical protein